MKKTCFRDFAKEFARTDDGRGPNGGQNCTQTRDGTAAGKGANGEEAGKGTNPKRLPFKNMNTQCSFA